MLSEVRQRKKNSTHYHLYVECKTSFLKKPQSKKPRADTQMMKEMNLSIPLQKIKLQRRQAREKQELQNSQKTINRIIKVIIDVYVLISIDGLNTKRKYKTQLYAASKTLTSDVMKQTE